MNPMMMAEKLMFPTHTCLPIRWRAGCRESGTPGSAGGMAQTSWSDPAIGGAVPTHSSRVELGDLARAIKDFDAAIEMDPNEAGPHYNRGCAPRSAQVERSRCGTRPGVGRWLGKQA